MCLAVPGKILKTDQSAALVDFQGNRMEVCTTLTPEAKVNDWVLVHAGFAISIIDEHAAKETWSYLQAMSAADPTGAVNDAETADD